MGEEREIDALVGVAGTGSTEDERRDELTAVREPDAELDTRDEVRYPAWTERDAETGEVP